MKRYQKDRRAWLNSVSDADTGAVQSSVEYEDWGHGSNNWYIAADMSIWDCSKKITLSFGFGNERDLKKRIKKIRTLTRFLEQLETDMLNAKEIADENIES